MKKPSHLKRNIVLAVLLALLCISGVELAACRYFEPEIYERIVAPARYAAAVVVDTGRAGLDAAAQFCRDVGDAAARFAVRTGERAAALWVELTTPKEKPEKLHDPHGSDDPNPSPSAEPPVTELLHAGGRQLLTGGIVDVTYFCQSDDQWKDLPYGTDTIGPYGCGPTVMAITVASLTDTETDPAVMSDWAVEHGYWARRSGSYNSIVQGTARSFGILAEPFPSREADDVLDTLRQGKMLVALVGPGHFTNGGHFILLRGITPDGEVLVADPNSLERSLMLWDAQTILDELSTSRSYGETLWALWMPDT
ncbi:MAG: C39 family peptidase [Oscillospiraceae bacterium]|nr:C39 family peptidase [Oscillospiraceae bacterium]